MKNQGLVTRNQLLARIAGLLGGRAAEEMIFGEDEVTTGASNDIEKVTYLARQMVTRFGMSELGLLALEQDNNNYAGSNAQGEYSEEIAAKIDMQVRSIVEECHQQAQKIIRENRAMVDQLVDILIDKETIEGDEFRQLLDTVKDSLDSKIKLCKSI
jgi:cell division protease FtsH